MDDSTLRWNRETLWLGVSYHFFNVMAGQMERDIAGYARPTPDWGAMLRQLSYMTSADIHHMFSAAVAKGRRILARPKADEVESLFATVQVLTATRLCDGDLGHPHDGYLAAVAPATDELVARLFEGCMDEGRRLRERIEAESAEWH